MNILMFLAAVTVLGGEVPIRSRAEVEACMSQAGSTLPAWRDSVKLEYPPTLDLTWARAPQGAPWNPDKWLGQYLWGVVNPNPDRHKPGIVLLHHVLTVNKADPAKLAQTARELGRAYGRYLGDWARAAYWWRKGGAERDSSVAVNLAECYWRLGCKPMAAELLQRAGPTNAWTIRLWSQMGETGKALAQAQALARTSPHEGYFIAGDVCRDAKRHEDAIAYYQKVLSAAKPAKRHEHYVERARANMEAVRIFDSLDLRRVRDGVWSAASLGYRGDVEVGVVVKNGRIESVCVREHEEDGYFYNLCDPLLLKAIVRQQGVKGVDAITGATVTSEAIINATAKALADGMQ